MASFTVENSKPKKIHFINSKNSIDTYIKKFDVVQNGTRKTVWKSGNTVTYVVDSSITPYTVEAESGVNCCSLYTPEKSGWTFAGWRKDKTASSSVETTVTMDDSPITLYAVFKKAVNLTYHTGSLTTPSGVTTKYSYYNNNNIVHPSFDFTSIPLDGWGFRGWVT